MLNFVYISFVDIIWHKRNLQGLFLNVFNLMTQLLKNKIHNLHLSEA